MTAQNDQRSLSVRPNEQSQQSMQRNSPQAAIAPRRGSSLLGFGITPQEFFSSSPFSLMRRMTEEMDRVIHEFGLERERGDRAGWSPAIEVTEGDGKYNVRAELPGLSPNDVKIEVVDNALVVQGERKVEREEKEGGVQRTERQYGLFYRSIPLPEGQMRNTPARSSRTECWKSRYRSHNRRRIAGRSASRDKPNLRNKPNPRRKPRNKLHKRRALLPASRRQGLHLSRSRPTVRRWKGMR